MKLDDPYLGFQASSRAREIYQKLQAFMEDQVYPNERLFHEQKSQGERWQPVPLMEELKAKAKTEGLWNLFLPESEYGAGLTNLEYAPMAELMGRSWEFAPEVFNCSAPDTGNMEVLIRYGTAEQKERWLTPLLTGEIRSCFGMTEPDVASSDASNISTSIKREGEHYIINGRKWFTTGALHPNCRFIIVMGVTEPDADPHRRHSMVIVPLDSVGFKVVRDLPIMHHYAPEGHCEVLLKD